MLAGALDVVYYQSNGSCRAKYLATFLYVGGYLVLAKVPKGGKAYEAKHWFPLAGFEIVDQEDDEALPYAFHLCCPTAQIHFAASCQLEKTIWMTAIQESLAIMPSAWVNEPTINLPTDIRPLVFAAPEDVIGSEWAATPLPTIQSMSELETPGESSNGPAPPTSSPRKIPKTIARAESLIIQQNHDLVKLSRRTSTTSIRQQVDNGLHDVLSDTFVAVRSQVLMRDEELFQLRKKPGNVSRSNSALSISGAFNTRRRRDSATLMSRRKKAAAKATNLMLARRSKSSSAKLKRQRLSLLPSSAPPLPNKMDSDENMPVVERSQSPSPLTRGPSAASSNTNSILPSPVELTMPLPTPGSRYSRSPDSRRAERPKRTTSMVDNFKYFFQSRSTSPTPSYQRSPQVSVVNLDIEPETHGGLIQWWRRGSIRRRAQSYPEAATDDSAPVTPAASSDDSSHAELKAITDRDLLTASPTMLSANGRHRHVSFSQNRTTLARRRSLFASTTFASTTRLDQPSSLGTSNMPQIHRSKTLKNLFSFQRSPSHSGELSRQPT
ncbi:hypothetical protein BC629DRAFT_1593733 [Irpex lacteus]|nr:hypothetical protein BC629DRAFT_1593733 [Irpex lacteus]